jgi:hypothetical protein
MLPGMDKENTVLLYLYVLRVITNRQIFKVFLTITQFLTITI